MLTALETAEQLKLTEAWTQFRYHAVQHSLWNCQARFVSVPAGRGSGKTELAKRRLVRFLPIKKPWSTPRYFYGAPTERQARRIAWRHLINLIPTQWIREIRNGEGKIITRFGSELHIVGLDQPQRVEGDQWDGCVLDESCDLKPGIFDLNVMPMLAHRAGWCWRIGVPKRHGPSAAEFREFHERACSGALADAAGFSWPSDDILSDKQLAYARSMMDSLDYREQFGGVFLSAGGGVFHSFERAYNVRAVEYHRDRAMVIGSDFNVDPMAWVVGHRYKNRIEWFDELFLRNTNTPAALDVLWKRYSTHLGGFEFYGDATSTARKTSATQSDYNHIASDKRFLKAGRTIHYPTANPRVADRFAACNALFRNADDECRMFIAPTCKNLIKDCEARAYRAGTREPDDHGQIGHITDALGYPVYRLFPVDVRIQTRPQTVTIRTG